MQKIDGSKLLFFLFAFLLGGCTSLSIEDCGDAINHPGNPRIRSSEVRMQLEYPAAAARRVLPYAVMSALAYETPPGNGCDYKPADSRDIQTILDPDWHRVQEVEEAGPCGDATGLLYKVWKKTSGDTTEVVIAFRGTIPGLRSWYYGNLWGITHYFTGNNQYLQAREYSHHVIKYFRDQAARDGSKVKFYATGHSLGGGLAQNVFYDAPQDYVQVFAFAPSSVTSFTDQPSSSHIEACDCKNNELGDEARIYRIYESYEILGNLRFPHKLFFYPQRYIQEIRFAFDSTWNQISRHSIRTLAFELDALNKDPAQKYPKENESWYEGLGMAKGNVSCTKLFMSKHEKSCELSASSSKMCPK